MTTFPAPAERHHVALHLAHRWFAWLEAPGGDLDTHLKMFDPSVRLSGSRGGHVFATDHRSLVAWFATIPDAVSSHHIVHTAYADTGISGDPLETPVFRLQIIDDGRMPWPMIRVIEPMTVATDSGDALPRHGWS